MNGCYSRYPEEQTSISIRLGGAKSYYIQVTGAQSGNADCMSVGVQFPDGKFSRPISGDFISFAKLGIQKILLFHRAHESCTFCLMQNSHRNLEI